MKEKLKWYESPKMYLMNENLMEWALTIATLLLALVIYIVAFGLITAWDWEYMIEPKNVSKAIGFFLALEVLQRRFTRLADRHGREVKKVDDCLKEQETLTKKIDDRKALAWLINYNKENRENESNEKRALYKERLTNELSIYKIKLDHYNSLPSKKHRFIRKLKRNKYQRLTTKLERDIVNAENMVFEIKYEPIELNDLRFKGFSSNDRRPKKKRYNASAAKDSSRIMTVKNLIQATIFFGFTGAILGSASTTTEIVTYIAIMLVAFPSTMMGAYILSFMRTTGIWYIDQFGKLNDLKLMVTESLNLSNEEVDKILKGDDSVSNLEKGEVITHEVIKLSPNTIIEN
jgi:hypothetical protein